MFKRVLRMELHVRAVICHLIMLGLRGQKFQDCHVISSLPENIKNWGYMLAKAQKKPCQHLDPKFRQLSTGKTPWVSISLSGNKNCLFKRTRDEIILFDGIQ